MSNLLDSSLRPCKHVIGRGKETGLDAGINFIERGFRVFI